MNPDELRILSLRQIPASEVAQLKRRQHARMIAYIGQIEAVIASTPLESLWEDAAARSYELLVEDHFLYSRSAWAMWADVEVMAVED